MHLVKAALVVLLGLGLAAGMVLAGVWQFRVYQRQGAEAAAARAAESPVSLPSVARAGAPVGDGYGRTVTFRGAYEGEHEVLVPAAERPDTFQVVTLFRLDNGDAIAVVRGLVVGGSATAPPAPRGPLDQAGVLLPSEEAVTPAGPAGIGSVRVAQLAQLWPGPLIDAFVVLTPEDAASQQLTPAEVALPDAGGRLRNAAYGLQWWLFAAFSVVMAIRIARDVGRPAVAAGRPDPRLPSSDGRGG
jgi:cytochrome oxidase assembly protein ShyY1